MPKPTPAPAPDATLSPGLRRYLYFTAATTGAVVLIVEILGAKMLSPYVGTSHFVWTAQITVTLISLAAGYWFGGWLVDRSQKLNRLYACILGAAVYLAFTIPFCESVAYASLKFAHLATGSLLASLFLFAVPLTLLAAVGPFVIRVLASSLNTVGSQVGRLSALSTLGSVLGTLLIGYVLIPFFPNSVTMYITAGILLAVCLAYFLIWERKGPPIAAVLMAAILGLLVGYGGVRQEINWQPPNGKELYHANSNFGKLQVIEFADSGYRYYLNDYLFQNTYDPETNQSISLFTYMLHGLPKAYVPEVRDVLCIGLGVGIVPMEFARDGAKVDVVEINPSVVTVGQKFFGLEPEKLNLTIGDGRQFLNECNKQYDVVVLDAFLGDSSPSHLMTQQAFAAIRKVLRPDGVLVINTFGDFDRGKDFSTASLEKTLRSVFLHVKIHNESNRSNVMYVAGEKELQIRHEPDFSNVHAHCRSDVQVAFTRTVETNPDHGIVLTDDYNPVEFYDAPNREDTRRRLAGYMRRN